MKQKNISDYLKTLTYGLAPANNVPKKQLETLNAALTDVLQHQIISEILPNGVSNFDKINALAKTVQTRESGVHKLIDPPTGKGVLQYAPTSEQPITSNSEYRVFRREVPIKTSQYEASVPKWAAGQAVDYTLGPFTDNFGKLFWFDFYKLIHYVSVVRGSDVFLQIPIRGFLSAHQHYNLPAGSVWIRSQLITASAPVGAYTGLKIKGGAINFKKAVTISNNSIIIVGGDECELLLDLDQRTAVADVSTSTGDDAKNQNIQLPTKVRIICSAGTTTILEAGDMFLETYGTAYKFVKDNAVAPSFDPILNRILVAYNNNVPTFSAPPLSSPHFGGKEGGALFQLSETAAIAGNYWALAVTVSAITQLGEAAGIGAIAIKVKPGLKAVWKNVEKGPVQLNNAYIMSEPGRIAITAMDAASGKANQKLNLWEVETLHATSLQKIRSVVDLQYGKHFILLYNSLSSGTETIILINAAMQARIDRPVSADKLRLKINALSATAVFFEIKNQFWVYVQAINMMQQLIAAKKTLGLNPISFALSNALIKTTPVDDFYLVGKLLSRNDINEGTVAMNCPMYFLLPTLPDPYVTNYQPFNYRGRDQLSSSNSSHISLAPVVQWTVPTAPQLTFLFVPDDTASNIFIFLENNHPANKIAMSNELLAVSNEPHSRLAAQSSLLTAQSSTKDTQLEDATNTAGLRAVFDRNLNLSSESIFLLDVSTNADLFGVGLGFSRQKNEHLNPAFPLAVIGIDLVTDAFNTRIYTLPQIQWEPIWTIQNPDVTPYPFPSPATSPDTGDPTIIGTTSYELVPIAPKPVIEKFLATYNDKVKPQKMGALFSLPFGMKAAAVLDNASDPTKQGAEVSVNNPHFDDQKLQGALQITVLATSPNSGPNDESPGFKGATIQTRNLIDLFGGNIPLGLSVLGPVVDTIFNGEFKPGGAKSRVPLERMDISGYGATIFSNWLNPNAKIAATSQARFDVLIGRTAHEVIQVKSILYPWGIAVVRTITIQRTSGGGVTRYDSGWKAQGAGVYDFSYTDSSSIKHPNPFDFHPGIVHGMYNVTEIRDTGRIYNHTEPNPLDSVIMQEVFFNGNADIEDVIVGAPDGMVPCKRQRGFVQLAPYQKPLTAQQFSDLITKEGALGGAMDCVVSVGNSGQPMRIVKIDVNNAENFGSKLFVTAGHGSLALPREGSWSQVKRQASTADIVVLNEDGALPLIREGKLNSVPIQPYRFADPIDILTAASPKSDYAILHSMGSQKVLFLRPTIQRNDKNIRSTLKPYFADSYALMGSKGIFPALDPVFQLGSSGTVLQVNGAGKLKLMSGGNLKLPVGYTKDLLNNGTSRIYIDYSDVSGGSNTTDIAYSFDSADAIAWKANIKNQTIVVDLLVFKSLISVTTNFDSDASKLPSMGLPKVKFGSVLQPIIDLLSFLGDFNMAQAFMVNMGNATTDSWQTKFRGSLKGLSIQFDAPTKLEIKVFGKTITETGASIALPPIKLGFEIEIEAYYNMRPFSFTSNSSETDISKEKNDMLSIGAALKFGGEIHILCFAVSPTLGIYFVGIIEFEFGIDSKEGKSFGFKVAVGLELATNWPVVGEISVMMALGLEMEWKDTGSSYFVLMMFKGEAELLEGLIAIGISIEAKGGQETSGGKTSAVCEVEFAAEVTLAWVIHFEFDVTWQEKKELT